ncbi:helix-turn-helix transcriptional regulator [Pelagibius litoralis]|uniref:Helix-turn-helix transcriptional regulator n=1 Tax=Pelagibius litoralis TaxID=374515 RepID=A0A967EZX7_9PROT|nr:helix-turn-helix transcriptional regulator [Pelagibius litoralis]NIA70459.1 helix-turn-helix transcriptional regulator [Pelagibius litoralis]
MKPHTSLIDTVACIYRLALAPEGQWSDALDRIAWELGAIGASFHLVDPRCAELCVSSASSFYLGLSYEQWQQWAEKYGKSDLPSYQALMAMRETGFHSDMSLLGYNSEEEHRTHPSIRYAIEEFGTRHRAGTRLNLHDAWLDVLAVQYAAERGPITKAETETGALIIPHMAKSVEMHRAFALLRSRHDAVVAALDRWHVGICIVLEGGSIVVSNRHAEAILDAEDGLKTDRQRRLCVTGSEENGALQKAIRGACATALGSDLRAETLMTVKRPSCCDSYLISVSPLGNDGQELDRGFTGALVAIIDPTKSDSISTAGMGEIYDLTRTEQEVCRLLAKGCATGDIADIRNLQVETVRSYVKSVLAKTRTHSRADLVRLAILLNPPIDAPDEKP